MFDPFNINNMSKNKEKWVLPTNGEKYGFPKVIPENEMNVIDWVIDNGYPHEEIQKHGGHFSIQTWHEKGNQKIYEFHAPSNKSIINPKEKLDLPNAIDPSNFDFDTLMDFTKNSAQSMKFHKERKYLPTLAELIDRLSIAQLKEVFIADHKKEYAEEIKDIVHDIQLLIDASGEKITSETIRAIVVLSQMNLHIWHNESNYRKGIKDGNNLELTHGINGIRNTAKNKIQEVVGGRKDYKIDCLASEFKDWEISW